MVSRRAFLGATLGAVAAAARRAARPARDATERGSPATEPARADYFVAPSGDDAWSGRQAKPMRTKSDGPFATTARAQLAARDRVAHGLERDIRVLVRGGIHYLPTGLAFGPADSGTAQHSITYAA